jgi:hypothetical protein
MITFLLLEIFFFLPKLGVSWSLSLEMDYEPMLLEFAFA